MTSGPTGDPAGLYREGSEPVAGYVLERLLGRGNFGEVWRAKSAGVQCALKIVQLGGEYPEVGDREVRSLQLVKRLSHSRICGIQGIWIKDWHGTILDIDSIDKVAIKQGRYQSADGSTVLDREKPPTLVVAMRLAQYSLHDLLKQYRDQGRRGIPLPELMGYMRDAARGLDYLHDPKDIDGNPLDAVVHCDIKPQNILKHHEEALIGDLGIARRWDAATGMTYKTEGVPNFLTPFYAAPELWSDRPVPATDQYALAVTLFQCLTDRLPLGLSKDELRDRTAVMMAHVGGRMRFRKGLELAEGLNAEQQTRLSDVLQRATTPDATKRFPNCVTFIQSVETALAGEYLGSSAGFALSNLSHSNFGEPVPAAGTSGSVPVITGPAGSIQTGQGRPRGTEVETLAATSAVSPQADQIDTAKTQATIEAGGVDSIDAPSQETMVAPDVAHSTGAGTSAVLLRRVATLVAVVAIVGVAAWQFVLRRGPATPPSVETPPGTAAAANVPAPAGPEPPKSDWAAAVATFHRQLDGDQLAEAKTTLAEVQRLPSDDPAAWAIGLVAGARLLVREANWTEAQKELAALDAHGSTIADALNEATTDELKREGQAHAALYELLELLTAAQWPVKAGPTAKLQREQAAAALGQLAQATTAPAAEANRWAGEYRAAVALAAAAIDALRTELWNSETPAADDYQTLAALVPKSDAGAEASWKGAVRANLGPTLAERLPPLGAYLVLTARLPAQPGQGAAETLASLAAGQQIPADAEEAGRMVVAIPQAVASLGSDAAQQDVGLQAMARLSERFVVAPPEVLAARATLMQARLWTSIDHEAPPQRLVLAERAASEQWQSLLKPGGVEAGATMVLLDCFAAECTSLSFDQGPANLADQVRESEARLARAALASDMQPPLAPYRAYVAAIVGSYREGSTAPAADQLVALFDAGQPQTAALALPDRKQRAAQRLVSAAQRAAGLPAGDAKALNAALDVLTWKLPAEAAGHLPEWLATAERLDPAGNQPARDLLATLAWGAGDDRLDEAASKATALIEQHGLVNAQTLHLLARAGIRQYTQAAAGESSGKLAAAIASLHALGAHVLPAGAKPTREVYDLVLRPACELDATGKLDESLTPDSRRQLARLYAESAEALAIQPTWEADTFGSDLVFRRWERAVNLDPDDPQYRLQRGLARLEIDRLNRLTSADVETAFADAAKSDRASVESAVAAAAADSPLRLWADYLDAQLRFHDAERERDAGKRSELFLQAAALFERVVKSLPVDERPTALVRCGDAYLRSANYLFSTNPKPDDAAKQEIRQRLTAAIEHAIAAISDYPQRSNPQHAFTLRGNAQEDFPWLLAELPEKYLDAAQDFEQAVHLAEAEGQPFQLDFARYNLGRCQAKLCEMAWQNKASFAPQGEPDLPAPFQDVYRVAAQGIENLTAASLTPDTALPRERRDESLRWVIRLQWCLHHAEPQALARARYETLRTALESWRGEFARVPTLEASLGGRLSVAQFEYARTLDDPESPEAQAHENEALERATALLQAPQQAGFERRGDLVWVQADHALLRRKDPRAAMAAWDTELKAATEAGGARLGFLLADAAEWLFHRGVIFRPQDSKRHDEYAAALKKQLAAAAGNKELGAGQAAARFGQVLLASSDAKGDAALKQVNQDFSAAMGLAGAAGTGDLFPITVTYYMDWLFRSPLWQPPQAAAEKKQKLDELLRQVRLLNPPHLRQLTTLTGIETLLRSKLR
ncbi:MAG: protein kinase [Pirellulales bacterium]|nr:protein kinase [Pirellulales bacterium]